MAKEKLLRWLRREIGHWWRRKDGMIGWGKRDSEIMEKER
jgi:hypothetical protein